jgi:membrane protein implicated in regulation of membrane protease activity
MCHIILALPVLGLALFYFLPFWTALPLYGAVLAVSLLIYFKIASAMMAKVRTGLEDLIGAEAVVIEDISPEGKVEFYDEIWNATAAGRDIRRGAKVRISGARGLTLVVEDVDGKRVAGPQRESLCHSL